VAGGFKFGNYGTASSEALGLDRLGIEKLTISMSCYLFALVRFARNDIQKR